MKKLSTIKENLLKLCAQIALFMLLKEKKAETASPCKNKVV